VRGARQTGRGGPFAIVFYIAAAPLGNASPRCEPAAAGVARGLTSRRDPRDDAIMSSLRLIRIVLALSCAVALAGCDSCGDWPWTAKQKTCHGEAVR
jgi:hypothetical protein